MRVHRMANKYTAVDFLIMLISWVCWLRSSLFGVLMHRGSVNSDGSFVGNRAECVVLSTQFYCPRRYHFARLTEFIYISIQPSNTRSFTKR